MLVKDGVIDQMFIEPQKPGDPFEVSDADTMLNYINADAKRPVSICVISKPGCPFCIKAKEDLGGAGLTFEEIVLGKDASITSLRAVSGKETAPQVFINGEYIGGSEELTAYLAK